MKSLMLDADYITDPENCKRGYSNLQVCKSNAGYYIGSVFHDGDIEVPGTRDTGYFKRKEDAKDFLKRLESGDENAISQLRTHP